MFTERSLQEQRNCLAPPPSRPSAEAQKLLQEEQSSENTRLLTCLHRTPPTPATCSSATALRGRPLPPEERPEPLLTPLSHHQGVSRGLTSASHLTSGPEHFKWVPLGPNTAHNRRREPLQTPSLKDQASRTQQQTTCSTHWGCSLKHPGDRGRNAAGHSGTCL